MRPQLHRAVHAVDRRDDIGEPHLMAQHRVDQKRLGDRRRIGEARRLDHDAVEFRQAAVVACIDEIAKRLLQIGT